MSSDATMQAIHVFRKSGRSTLLALPVIIAAGTAAFLPLIGVDIVASGGLSGDYVEFGIIALWGSLLVITAVSSILHAVEEVKA